jgi:hypothetical protein
MPFHRTSEYLRLRQVSRIAKHRNLGAHGIGIAINRNAAASGAVAVVGHCELHDAPTPSGEDVRRESIICSPRATYDGGPPWKSHTVNQKSCTNFVAEELSPSPPLRCWQRYIYIDMLATLHLRCVTLHG